MPRIYTRQQLQDDLVLFGLTRDTFNSLENKEAEIKKILRRLALKLHPDKVNSDPNLSPEEKVQLIEQMKGINNANDNILAYLRGDVIYVNELNNSTQARKKKPRSIIDEINEIVTDANQALSGEYEKLYQDVLEYAFIKDKGLKSTFDITVEELLAFERETNNKFNQAAMKMLNDLAKSCDDESAKNYNIYKNAFITNKQNRKMVEDAKEKVCKSLKINLDDLKTQFDQKTKNNETTKNNESKRDIANKQKTKVANKQETKVANKQNTEAAEHKTHEKQVYEKPKGFFARHKWKIVAGAVAALLVVGGLFSFGILSAVGLLTGAGILATVGGGLAVATTTVGGSVAAHVGIAAVAIGAKAAIGAGVLSAGGAVLGGSTGMVLGLISDNLEDNQEEKALAQQKNEQTKGPYNSNVSANVSDSAFPGIFSNSKPASGAGSDEQSVAVIPASTQEVYPKKGVSNF